MQNYSQSPVVPQNTVLGPLKFSFVPSIVQYMTNTECFTILASLNRDWRNFIFSPKCVPMLPRQVFERSRHQVSKLMDLFPSLQNMRVQGLKGNQITTNLIRKVASVRSLEVENIILNSPEWARLIAQQFCEHYLTALHILCPPQEIAPKFFKLTGLAVLKLDCTPEHLFQIMPFPLNLEKLEINVRMPRRVKQQYLNQVFILNLAKLSRLHQITIRKYFWGLPFNLTLLNLHKEVQVIRLINVELQNINEVITQAKYVRHLQISSRMKCYSNLLSHLYPGKANEKFIHNRLPHLSVLKFKCFHGTLKDEIELPHSLHQLEVTLVQQQQSKGGQFTYRFNFNQSKKVKSFSLSDQIRTHYLKAEFQLIQAPGSFKDIKLRNAHIQGISNILSKQEKLKRLDLEQATRDIYLDELPHNLQNFSLIVKQPLELKPILKGLDKLQTITLSLSLAQEFFVIKNLPKLKFLELKSVAQKTTLLNLPHLEKLSVKGSSITFEKGVISELEIINESHCFQLKGIEHYIQNDLVREVVFDSGFCAASESILCGLQEDNQHLKVIKVQYKSQNLGEFVHLIDKHATRLQILQITRIPNINEKKGLVISKSSLRVLKIEAFTTCFCELPLTISEECTRIESVTLTGSLIKLSVNSNLKNLDLCSHVLNLYIAPNNKVANLKLALDSVYDNPFLKSKTDKIHETGFNFLTQVQQAELLLRVNEPIHFTSKFERLTQLRFGLCHQLSSLILEELTASSPNLAQVEVHSAQSDESRVAIKGNAIKQVDLFEAKEVDILKLETTKDIKIRHRNPSLKLEYMK